MFSFVGATFTFQDGSATGGSDFGDTAGVISVGPQVAEQCITVNITNDNTPENDEVTVPHILLLSLSPIYLSLSSLSLSTPLFVSFFLSHPLCMLILIIFLLYFIYSLLQ